MISNKKINFNEKESLKKFRKDGYVLIKNFYKKDIIQKIKKEIILAKNKNVKKKLVPRLNKYGSVKYNIQNKCSTAFFSLTRSKLLMNFLCKILNDKYYKQIKHDKPNFILRGMIARNGTGEGLPPHIDSFVPYLSKHCFICNITISIDDSLASNGGLEIVKSSHISNEYAKNSKKYKTLETKSGDLLIWDSRLWHKTSDNFSKKDRWSIICSFSRWWIKPTFQFWKNINKNMLKKLNQEERAILGFRSTIPFDESEKIDLKT